MQVTSFRIKVVGQCHHALLSYYLYKLTVTDQYSVDFLGSQFRKMSDYIN
jgi:hypothetical protein